MFRMFAFVVAAAAAIFGPGTGSAQVTIESRLAPGQPPVVITHRGKGGGAPENSLAGIEYAIERGVDMIGINVQITRDGRYILMHDPALSRTTNVAEVFPDGTPHRDPADPLARQYLIRDYTLDDISKLRLLDPQGGDHPVPTLDETLDLAAGKLLVMLGLKNWEIESLVSVLERHDTDNLMLFTLTDTWKLLDTAEATGIGVFTPITAQDASAGLDRMLDRFGENLVMVDVGLQNYTPEFTAKAEAHGVWVALAGENFADRKLAEGDPAPWRDLLEKDAAAYWTGYPGAVMDLMGR